MNFTKSTLMIILIFTVPADSRQIELIKKGKITKVYDTYLTPFEKFMKLDNPEQYLKQGITLEIFKEQIAFPF